MLTTDYDVSVMIESVKAAQRFAAAQAWDGYITGPYIDSVNATTDEGIKEYMRKQASTIKHPFCTARLSKKDGEGVADGQLLLKKAKGVRIVDASVFVSSAFVSLDSPNNILFFSPSFLPAILKP